VFLAIVNVTLGAVIALAVHRLSVAEPVRSVDLVPGAILMAVGGYGLTLVAGVYVQHVIARVSGVYGPFAATIGLLAYISLIVQLFVIATEVNVVRAKRLWPRSLAGRALGTADARAVDLTLRRERMLSHEQLTERGLTEDAASAVGDEDVEPPEPGS
jgi:membrane protein